MGERKREGANTANKARRDVSVGDLGWRLKGDLQFVQQAPIKTRMDCLKLLKRQILLLVLHPTGQRRADLGLVSRTAASAVSSYVSCGDRRAANGARHRREKYCLGKCALPLEAGKKSVESVGRRETGEILAGEALKQRK